MSELSGRVAVVTGSTSGIGEGIARMLARAGADIVLNGFGPPERIEALQREIADEAGVRVVYSPADMRRASEIEALIRLAEDRFGSVDILVNNAGIQHVAPVEDFPPEKWDDVLAINLTSCFHAIRFALPAMRRNGWGRIVNIASVHGLVASAQKAAYVAAKHGLVGLTKVVGLETAQSPVTCNAICPGWVATPLVKAQIEDRAKREGKPVEAAERDLLAEKQPSLQFVTPEQLGGMVVFLCSPAAEQMRGQVISMDGGWSAQ